MLYNRKEPKEPRACGPLERGLWKGPGKFQRAGTLRDSQDMICLLILIH